MDLVALVKTRTGPDWTRPDQTEIRRI